MAAFSRGLGLAMSQRIFCFAPTTGTASKTCAERPMARVAQAICRSPIIQAARNLQTSSRLQASKYTPSLRPKSSPRQQASSKPQAPHTRGSNKPTRTDFGLMPPRQTPISNSHGRLPPTSASTTQLAAAAKLAELGRPTILYKGPGHFWLRFSSISAALFCVIYAGINYYGTIMYPPPDLSKWVVLAFACICLFMGAMGYLFLISTARIVRRITAVPTSSLPESYIRLDTSSKASKMSWAEQTALRALQASPIALECEVAGTIPLIGNRRIVAALSEVCVPFNWQQAPVCRGEKLPTGLAGWHKSMRRGLLAEGFSPVLIKGQRYKIDVLAGQVFDHGRTPEILLPAQPDKLSSTWLDRLLFR